MQKKLLLLALLINLISTVALAISDDETTSISVDQEYAQLDESSIDSPSTTSGEEEEEEEEESEGSSEAVDSDY